MKKIPQALNYAHPKIQKRQKLLLQELGCNVAILPSGQAPADMSNVIPIFQSQADFFYYTGIEEPYTIAIFTNAHPQHHYILFWKEADEKQQIWHGDKLTCKEIKEKTGADEVYPYDLFSIKIADYIKGADVLYYPIGQEEAILESIQCCRIGELKKLAFAQKIPKKVHDFSLLAQESRVKKDTEEIQLLRHAISITVHGFEVIMTKNWQNCQECEVEAELQSCYRKNGALHSFPPIIAGGSNTTVLHYNQNKDTIPKNGLLLVDSGACYQHYCADITRTWPVSGKFSKEQRMVYSVVLHAQKAAIASILPGKPVEDFHKIAIEKLVEGLIECKILKGTVQKNIETLEYKTFYPHSTGHWLGLDVHDQTGTYYQGAEPRYFQPGMVLTVEPGLYFPTKNNKIPEKFRGIGIRIEDDILVTETGTEVLTQAVPKEIEELEKLLKK